MWFWAGLLMFFGCHIAINVCLSFSYKYKNTKQNMDLFVAISAGVCCAGATIFCFSYIYDLPALLIGGIIGFCTGGLHHYINMRNNKMQNGFESNDNLYALLMQAEQFAEKIQRLANNPNHSEGFSKSEIANGLINLHEAQTKLNSFEYAHVIKLHQRFKADKSKRLINHKQYINWCEEMISHFDMIAPYYKYCGDASMEYLGAMMDEDKAPYRAKAKSLLEYRKLLKPDNTFYDEWLALNREFREEFYADDSDNYLSNSDFFDGFYK